MKPLLATLIILVGSGLVIAQHQSPQNTSCYSTHTFGAGANKFTFCISNTGTLINLESPASFKQLGVLEGYILCGGQTVYAYDAGNDFLTWSSLDYQQPNGPNTLPLTIIGRTVRGEFQVTQTFEATPEEKSVRITVAVKNISGVGISNLKFARYFDADLSNDSGDDIFDTDADSVWGRDSGSGAGHHGLLLTALSLLQSHTVAVEKRSDWYPLTTPGTAATCSPLPQASPTAPGNYVGRLTYNLGTINTGVTKIVKLVYRRI
ncbi:MAG TPA: hypothetical protein VF708_20035 [Pyrinomonadaceae bacterium]